MVIEAIIAVGKKFGIKFRILPDYETILEAQFKPQRVYAGLIKFEWQSRPADMKAEIRCNEHGITKANYYYRLRRVRKACLEACNSEPAFVEFPIPAALPTAMPSIDSSDVKPVAVLRNSKGLVLEVYNHTSADIIRSILEVLVHAE